MMEWLSPGSYKSQITFSKARRGSSCMMAWRLLIRRRISA
jgi:hypothetical protein